MPITEYSAAVLADTPKMFWQMQEASGQMQDSSGNALHSTGIAGTPTYQVAGPMVGAYAIRMDIGAAERFSRTQVSTVTDNFTTEFWMQWVAQTAQDNFAFSGDASTNGWMIYLGATGNFFVFLPGVGVSLTSSTADLDNGVWRHIVVVRDAGTWKYYVNGAVDTANAGTNAPNAPAGGSTSIGIAGNDVGANFSMYAIYETALSQARVLAHYQAAVLSASVAWLGA